MAAFGHDGAEAGIVLAIFSVGSLAGGLTLGHVPIGPWSTARRMFIVFVGTALAAFSMDFWWLALTLFIAGIGIAPALAVLFAIVSASVKFSDTAEAYGWVGTGQLIGAALGSALAGFLIDGYDAVGARLGRPGARVPRLRRARARAPVASRPPRPGRQSHPRHRAGAGHPELTGRTKGARMTHPPLAPLIPLSDGRAIPQVGYGMYKVPRADAAGLALTAIGLGYRHLDTAALYGNEAEAGAAVRECGLPREDVFLTSKVWNDDHGYDEPLRAFDAPLGSASSGSTCTSSTGPSRLAIATSTPGAHSSAPRRGPRRLDRRLELPRAPPRAHHRRDRRRARGEPGCWPWLRRREPAAHERLGIRTEAWSPLARGRLLGDAVLEPIAAKHGRSVAQVVLAWHVAQGTIVSREGSSPERIAQNLDVFSFGLDDGDVAAIAHSRPASAPAATPTTTEPTAPAERNPIVTRLAAGIQTRGAGAAIP